MSQLTNTKEELAAKITSFEVRLVHKLHLTSVQLRHTRLESQKTLFEQQVSQLSEDLKGKSTALIALQREKGQEVWINFVHRL